MKRLFLTLALIVGFVGAILAQETERKTAPYTFIGVQGGAQNTYNTRYAFGRTWTPTAAITVGHFFSPHVGLRAGFNGIWAKSNAPFYGANTQQFDFNYLTTSADVLVNMASVVGNRSYYPVNFYVIGGFGMHYAWDNDEALDLYNQGADLPYAEVGHRRAFNVRLGGQLEVNLHKNVAFNLEATYNWMTGQRKQAFLTDRSQLVVLAGLNFKFGYKKKKAEKVAEVVPVAEPVAKKKCDGECCKKKEVVPAPVVNDTNLVVYVYYSIRSSDATSNEEAKIKEIAQWLKDRPNATATITGYADKGTGNAEINQKYSQERADAVTKALVERYGIAASRLSTVAKGDTVQPFAENDKNRLVIVAGKK